MVGRGPAQPPNRFKISSVVGTVGIGSIETAHMHACMNARTLARTVTQAHVLGYATTHTRHARKKACEPAGTHAGMQARRHAGTHALTHARKHARTDAATNAHRNT